MVIRSSVRCWEYPDVARIAPPLRIFSISSGCVHNVGIRGKLWPLHGWHAEDRTTARSNAS